MHLAATILLTLLCALCFGCDRPPAPTSAARQRATPTLDKFECNRCHTIAGVDAPDPYFNCTGCHAAIVAGDGAPFPPDDVARWRPRIKHLVATPSLLGVERLQRSWFIDFVQRPHSIRPGLGEEMPRLPITPRDAAQLADELGLTDTTTPTPTGDRTRGAQLYAELGCATCHAYDGGGPTFEKPTSVAVRRAPDLRHARDRMSPATADAWLADPQSVKPDAMMQLRVPDATDRRDLVAYLFTRPLAPQRAAAPPPLPSPVERPVSWAEVNTQIFGATCQHCHTHGGPAVPGEGGAGNTGGFGYAGRGLVLSTYDGVVAGDGDELLRRLMARHHEVAGAPLDDVVGMPLGLPPVPLETIALLRGWLAQGSPR